MNTGSNTAREGESMKEIVVVREDENPPYCKGCWNENQSCGTPCQSCEKKEEWDCYILRIFTRKEAKP